MARPPKKTRLRERDLEHVLIHIKRASGQVTKMRKYYPNHPEMVDAYTILQTADSELNRAYRWKDKALERMQFTYEADSDEEAVEIMEECSGMAKEVLWSVFHVDRLEKLYYDLAVESDRIGRERSRQQREDALEDSDY